MGVACYAPTEAPFGNLSNRMAGVCRGAACNALAAKRRMILRARPMRGPTRTAVRPALRARGPCGRQAVLRADGPCGRQAGKGRIGQARRCRGRITLRPYVMGINEDSIRTPIVCVRFFLKIIRQTTPYRARGGMISTERKKENERRVSFPYSATDSVARRCTNRSWRLSIVSWVSSKRKGSILSANSSFRSSPAS